VNRFLKYWPILLLLVLYIVVPNKNPSIDAWYYAACVKFKYDIFQIHHLLYNFWGLVFYEPFHLLLNIDAMQALQFLNGFAAFFSLIVLVQILKNFEIKETPAVFLSFITGASFGFWRYATEAEAYILPILFSLLATFYLSKTQLRTRDYLLSSVFIVLSVLSHQIHLFWALALFVFVLKKANKQQIAYFTLILFFIPIIYVAVFYFSSSKSFLSFLLGEYQKGNAAINLNLYSIGLGCVSFVRSFFQVHGYMIDLISKYSFVFIVFVFLVAYLFLKDFKQKKHDFYTSKGKSSIWTLIFSLAFVMQLLFAILSDGNAEFMVMLPVLLLLTIVSRFKINESSWLTTFAFLVFLWNFCFGILPKNLLDFNQTQKQANLTIQNKEALFVWSNKPLIENQVCYAIGFNEKRNYVKAEEKYLFQIYHHLKNNGTVYTDQLAEESSFSRVGVLKKRNLFLLSDYFPYIKTDSFKNNNGMNYIYELQVSDKLLFLHH